MPGRAGSRQAPLTQLQVDQMWRALNRLLAIVNLPNTVVGAGPPAAKRKTCSSSGDIRYLLPIDGTTFGDRC